MTGSDKDRTSIPSRRNFIRAAGLGMAMPSAWSALLKSDNSEKFRPPSDAKNVIVTGIDLHTIKVNERGDWYFIELKTNKGMTGLGECSHAITKTTPGGYDIQQSEIKNFFELIKGQSPFNIEAYRVRGFGIASDKIKRTVFSAIEQALWDLNGKILGVPTYALLGGKLTNKIRVYANINRATNERDADGKRPVSSFQKNAEQAIKNGFTAIKLAPFDEMTALDKSDPQQIEKDIRHAINCIEGVRSVIGPDIDLLIDVHSHLNVQLAQDTAKRIESSKLYWFEEPVDPQKYPKETKTIRSAIAQVLAGGESVFGRKGYEELINTQALEIIMPDVKHCGGILELKYIAAMADAAGKIRVAPHNPSGPVATAASVSVCSGISNFAILEYAFGEVPWSSNLVVPSEHFKDGFLQVPDAPGLGIALNYDEIKKHSK